MHKGAPSLEATLYRQQKTERSFLCGIACWVHTNTWNHRNSVMGIDKDFPEEKDESFAQLLKNPFSKNKTISVKKFCFVV